MSAQQPVDVLAVMRRDAADAIAYRGPIHAPANMGRMCRESDEAIAAVAELVEAANRLSLARIAEVERGVAVKRSDYARLNAALAPFQTGGAE